MDIIRVMQWINLAIILHWYKWDQKVRTIVLMLQSWIVGEISRRRNETSRVREIISIDMFKQTIINHIDCWTKKKTQTVVAMYCFQCETFQVAFLIKMYLKCRTMSLRLVQLIHRLVFNGKLPSMEAIRKHTHFHLITHYGRTRILPSTHSLVRIPCS
jgi:hypothetical protein